MTNFNVLTSIRAYDFKPMADRPDCYIEGIVVETGMIKHPTFGDDMFEGYTILITGSSRANDPRIGDQGYVPFEMDFMDFDGRITEAA
tara:strand:- start:1 stop:264 length:264 start_codon:yes stop_codon:yes gene_type:complete